MTHAFQRYTAAGNTFIVMNTWEDPLSLSREAMRVLVRAACDYKNGIGADGMILINQPRGAGQPGTAVQQRPGTAAPRVDFRMDFYNPDGSSGMLCGNGARCAVEAARAFHFVEGNETTFEVLGAINQGKILPNGAIKVFFQDPIQIRLNFELPLEEGGSIPTSYVDLGSQHAVIFFEDLKKIQPPTDPRLEKTGEKIEEFPLLKKEGAGSMSDHAGGYSLEEFPVAQYGALVRWHPEFAPLGANANFIEVREDGEERYLRIRTFERGVEGETLACGTGCMSAAMVARLTGRIARAPIRLLTQSGEFVTVNFSVNDHRMSDHPISNLSLEGPVVAGESGTFIFDEEKHTLDVEYL